MFWNLPNINNKYTDIVNKIEKEINGLQVLSVKERSLSVTEYDINIKIAKGETFDIIEEFILKFASAKLIEPLSLEEISKELGLDIVFIEQYFKNLLQYKAIEDNREKIKTTELGDKLYQKGMIPLPLEEKKITIYYEPYFQSLYFKNTNIKLSEDNKLEFSMNLKKEKIPVEEVITVEEINKKRELFGIPSYLDFSSEITSVKLENNETENNVTFFEIWVYDLLLEQVFCRIWDEPAQIYRSDIAEYISEYHFYDGDNIPLPKEEIKPDALPKESGHSRKEQYESSVKEDIAKVRENTSLPKEMSNTGVKVLRNAEIKPAFMRELKQAKKNVFIISPWISENVVDSELFKILRDLAKNNVVIHIGWGIARTIQEEDRKPSDLLLKELNSIKDSKGLQTVFVTWLGNHHDKEIIIDDKIHMLGSFNWLSYRGDYLPRGESVYMVRDYELVKNVTKDIKKIFYGKLFKIMSSNKKVDYNTVYALFSLEHEEKSIQKRIDDLISFDTTLISFSLVKLFLHLKKEPVWLEQAISYFIRADYDIAELSIILNNIKTLNSKLYRQIVLENSLTLSQNGMIKKKNKMVNKNATIKF